MHNFKYVAALSVAVLFAPISASANSNIEEVIITSSLIDAASDEISNPLHVINDPWRACVDVRCACVILLQRYKVLPARPPDFGSPPMLSWVHVTAAWTLSSTCC